MERRRLLGGVVAAAGAVLVVVSALADVLGYGDPGFGWQQTLGVVVGAATIVVGGGLMLWRRDGAVTTQ